MDSASLYSRESIITEDAMQGRERGRVRERQPRDRVKREWGWQLAEKMLLMFSVLHACLCHVALVKGYREDSPRVG